jgi:hypothetical protein
MSEIETQLASKPTTRKVKPAQLAKEAFAEIQARDPEQIPIVEVLTTQSETSNGFVKYEQLALRAKDNALFTPEPNSPNKVSGVQKNLESAYAEAIVLQKMRQTSPQVLRQVVPPSLALSLGTVLPP